MCKWGPSRFQESGNVGHILKFLNSSVSSSLRYLKGCMVWSQFLVLSERGYILKTFEMICIFVFEICERGLYIKRILSNELL